MTEHWCLDLHNVKVSIAFKKMTKWAGIWTLKGATDKCIRPSYQPALLTWEPWGSGAAISPVSLHPVWAPGRPRWCPWTRFDGEGPCRNRPPAGRSGPTQTGCSFCAAAACSRQTSPRSNRCPWPPSASAGSTQPGANSAATVRKWPTVTWRHVLSETLTSSATMTNG